MARKSVAVIYGGRSGEHEVSLRSAASVAPALASRFEVQALLVDREGRFWLQPDATPRPAGGEQVYLAPTPADAGALRRVGDGQVCSRPDVYFPVLHGPYGEDGTLQGLLEMAGAAYSGSGVAASAAGMDKALMKAIFTAAGLPQTSYRVLRPADRPHAAAATSGLCYPLFVKPANLGSSVGVHKVDAPAGLADAVADAFRYDRKVLVEQGVAGAREIEVAVLGNDEAEATPPGEVVPDRAFYDYDSKYSPDSRTELHIPASLPGELSSTARRLALAAYGALDCAGFARVDLFLGADGRLFVNEINTIPGFTSISMFPKLWDAAGLVFGDLVARIVDLGLARHGERQGLRTSR